MRDKAKNNYPETCGECKYFGLFDIEYDNPEDECGVCPVYDEVVWGSDIACDSNGELNIGN